MCIRNKTAIILIGIPASGKSSFCIERLSAFKRINLDTLHTRNKEKLLLQDCFEKQESFVVDNTNPTAEDRKRYIKPAIERGYRIVGYYFKSVIRECVDRNEKRDGKAKVPSHVIANIQNKLEMPSYEEGFDELYYVSIEGNEFSIDKWSD